MAEEQNWYPSGTDTSQASSSLGDSWSSLDQYIPDEGIMDLGPSSPLHFNRETIMVRVLARLIQPTAATGGNPGRNSEQRPCSRQRLPPIDGPHRLPDPIPAAPYGASSTKRAKKSCIPVLTKTTVSEVKTNKLPAIQTGRGLVARTSSTRHPEAPPERLDIKRLSKPKMAVCKALELLTNNDWEKMITGLHIIRSLSLYHPEVAGARTPELHAAVIKEVQNLRSAVSRCAMVCLGDMFEGLKDKMLYGLTTSVRILLQKSGDRNIFLRDAAEEALSSMSLNIHPGRALVALIDGGISHLNAAIRTSAARQLHNIVLRMGPDYILCGGKGVTDRAIPAITRCAQDGCPEARMYGRKILNILSPHPQLMPMIKKYVTADNLPGMKKILSKIM